jgi:hypothetical protein
MSLGYSSTHDTRTSPPLPDVVGTRSHASTTGDTPLDMTVTRGIRPPPSYSQSLANYQSAPARPSVITCAPPASTSWADRSSDNKGANKDENGRQGHRRELLSGECVLQHHKCLRSVKVRAFWDIAPCSLGVDRRFSGAYCLHHQGDEWQDAVCTSETSVYFNETTRCYIPVGSNLHTCHRENLNSKRLRSDCLWTFLFCFLRTRFLAPYKILFHITIKR